MIFTRSTRVFSVVTALPLMTLATACNPGDLLGIGGDSGHSQFEPDYSIAAPVHRGDLLCKDADPTHLCVALNYVVYDNGAGQPVIQKNQAATNVQNLNSVWSQCHVQFYLENFTATDPKSYGLPYQPNSSDDLSPVRAAFADKNRLTVITTGQWTGDLGAQAPNAWTEMPSIGPFGTVLEASVATISNLIAHELGHYLNLPHVSDPYNVMNPVVYGNSLNITDTQCGEARATAISFWSSMLR